MRYLCYIMKKYSLITIIVVYLDIEQIVIRMRKIAHSLYIFTMLKYVSKGFIFRTDIILLQKIKCSECDSFLR